MSDVPPDKPAPPVIVLDYLLGLITAQHNQQPLYMQTVALSVNPFIESQNTSNSYWTLFDLDTAVGQQEDMLGEWVGISRFVSIPSRVFFTLDASDVGLDKGRWFTPYETDQELVRLDDEQYRLLLRAKIVANYWDGTIPGAYDAWDTLFAGTGLEVLIQDGFPAGERYFTFDDNSGGTFGFDHTIWRVAEELAPVFFSLDNPDLGFDTGLWLSQLTAYYVGQSRVHGNMHIIQALVGGPIDVVSLALFGSGALGLKSAGVGTDYVIQFQGSGPDSGLGLPLFALDSGPDSLNLWVTFDVVNLGYDQAPLFYPGAFPVDPTLPKFALSFDNLKPLTVWDNGTTNWDGETSWDVISTRPLTFWDNTVTTWDGKTSWDVLDYSDVGLDIGYWASYTEPNFYMGFDLVDDKHGLDYGQWLPAGALPGTLKAGRPWYPPDYSADRPVPPTGVTQPPVNLAGFDLAAWAWQLKQAH